MNTMGDDVKRVVIAGTFAIDFLLPSLAYHNHQLEMDLSFELVPYNQVLQQLLAPDSIFNNNPNGLNVILLRFADWLRFQDEHITQIGSKPISDEEQGMMESSFAAFLAAVHSYSSRNLNHVLILLCPSCPGGIYEEDWRRVFINYRDRLGTDLKAFPAIKYLDAEQYHELYEAGNVYDEIGDMMGHIPYTQDYVHLLGTLIVRCYYGLHSIHRKVIVTDCDNTIWNGVCGEAGARGINWDGNAGKLQQFLAVQSNRGMLICLCSKNSAADVGEVFDAHPEMPLQKAHITASRINWEPKSENIQSLSEELSLSPDSFIFIDDNPVECSEVRINCPGVLVIEWPPEGEDPVKILSQLWIFDNFSVTAEDKERARMYRAELTRRKEAEAKGDWQRFIQELELEVEMEPVGGETMERASQLTMRTNQFNFTTVRRTVGDLQTLLQAGNVACYIVKAKDRFGAYGVVGLLILSKSKTILTVDTFLLSCRVLGRGVEHRMIQWIAGYALEGNYKKVSILFSDSDRNLPARKFIDWLAAEYSGSKDPQGRVVFHTEKLLECRYTDYSGTELAERKEEKPSESKKPLSNRFQNMEKSVDFWLRNRTVHLLAHEIERFRQNSMKTNVSHDSIGHNETDQPKADITPGEWRKNRTESIQQITEVFCKYTSVPSAQLTREYSLESLSLTSKDIVVITSELHSLFHQVQPTLLFECRTLGEIWNAVLGNEENQDTDQNPGNHPFTTDLKEEDSGQGPGNPGARDIAIIGMSCRYPGADNIYRFWENLKQGQCSISEIPKERWDNHVFFSGDESEPCKTYSKWGAFIDRIAEFDAPFFKISPRQAALMDPQQRLLLEAVWNLLEDAGYHPENFEKKTGVFAGVISSDYGLYQNWLSLGKVDTFRNCDYYQIPNRISYFYDFHGPSIAVDTACSASGTAVHLACESLIAKGCNCAIVAGVNLIVHPSRFIQYSHAGMLSRDNQCRPFGDHATGTVIGEGIGTLLLKPYSKAIQDGDHIWGVIKGSAINSGGRTNGFTVPNPMAQAEVVSEALQKSGVDPGTISYIEAHGTGTALGDPIEIKGLESAFQQNAKIHPGNKQFCAIGSVKSNIGHHESGAAIAGIIKVLLQMKYKTLVPTLAADIPNPKIDFANSPFKIQHQTGPWERPILTADGQPVVFPLRAGVSSFGAGGSNFHIILEEPLCDETYDSKHIHRNLGSKHSGGASVEKHLILFSGQDESQLIQYIQSMAFFLYNHRTTLHAGTGIYTIENIAFTLRTSRKSMDFRLAIVAHSIEELIAKLDFVLNHEGVHDGNDGNKPKDVPGIYRGRKNNHSEISGLITGNPGKAFLTTIIIENDMDKLAQYWVAGGEIPENLLIYNSKPRRLSLPGYPFQGCSYWMENCTVHFSNSMDNTGNDHVAGSHHQLSYTLFEKSRRQIDKNSGFRKQRQGDILILGGHPELLNRLLPRFEESRFSETDELRCRAMVIATENDMPSYSGKLPVDLQVIDSYDFEECSNIMQQLILENRRIGCILHLGAFSTGEPRGVQDSFYPVFAVCQQMVKNKHCGPFTFLSFYPAIKGAENPLWGGISGFGRTLREENPEIDFRTICIHLPQNGMDGAIASQIAEIIEHELLNGSSEPEIHCDGSEKWGSYFQPTDWGTLDQKNGSGPSILPHEGDTYLITGGTGGIGLAVAGYLASIGKCNIVLCGKTAQNHEKMAELNRLSRMGAVVDYFQADVSNGADVDHLIQTIKEQYGKISGIFHCAGVLRDSFIAKKEKAEIDAVLAPKVQGTLLLDTATRDQDLDFFVLFSSLSGVLGNAGQSDYAYANHFLDSFSEWRNQQVTSGTRKGVTISINWPYWRDGGMKLSVAELEYYSDHTGLQPLPKALGIDILKTVLSLKVVQAIPCYGDEGLFSQVLNAPINDAHPPADNDFQTLRAEEPEARMAEWNDVAPYDLTRELLQNTLGEVIRMNPRDITEDIHFETLGIDSIAVRLFSHQIEKKIGKVSRTLLYECQSLKDLTEYFTGHYPNQLAKYFSQNAGYRSYFTTEQPRACPKESLKTGCFEKDIFQFGAEYTAVSGGSDPRREVNDIAIVGMSGMYPQAGDLREFWQNLKNGRDCVTRIPEDRWNNQQYFSPDKKESIHGKYYCEWGGFLKSVRQFDPLFFNIAPKEARAIDPQERLLLQSAWTALEDAGYSRKELLRCSGNGGGASVGVFAGVTTNDYQLLGAENIGAADGIGHSLSWSIANRISYCLNLRGPSIAVDGACSSSLLAVHLACESLQRGECEAAIAGAVNLFLHPFKYILNSQLRMLSAQGRCFAFSAEADGFVPAEGVGAFLLKRLDKAQADGDHIYAVIKGTAVNHGGRSNGYMAPNPEAQAEVIAKALETAGVNPQTISYLEAHGTGTMLGDPIEIDGLTRVFRKYSETKGYCSLGSVKSNIGHAEAAAGMASLTKVILQMQHHWIVPALYSEKLNPNIDFAETPFFIQSEGSQWNPPGIQGVQYPRRAGISSFGAGGANVHIIVEEYQEPEPVANDFPMGEVMIILSAAGKEQLRQYAARLLQFLNQEFSASPRNEKNGHLNLLNIAYTLQAGREELKERLAMVVSTPEELIRKLRGYCEHEKEIPGLFHGNPGNLPHNPDKFAVEQALLSKDLYKIAQLWVEGNTIDWRKLYLDTLGRGIGVKRISLPTYPFSQKEYWMESKGSAGVIHDNQILPVPDRYHFDMTGAMERIDDRRTEFTTALSLQHSEFLKAHILFGKAVLSGPTQLAMIFEAVYRITGSIRAEIIHMDFIKPIIVVSDEPRILTLALDHLQNDQYHFQFQSRPVHSTGDEWNTHSSGRLTRISGEIHTNENDTKVWASPELNRMDVESFYARLEAMGYHFEDSFKCITGLKASNGFSESKISGLGGRHDRIMEPGIIDSCIQMLLPTLPEKVLEESPHSIYVPVYVGGFTLRELLTDQMHCYGRRALWDEKKETLLGSLFIQGMDGTFIGKIDKFRLKRVDSRKLLDRSGPQTVAETSLPIG
jgi:FkbH-like protein